MRNVTPDMEADDWSTIRIRSGLKQSIEKDVLPLQKKGVPLFNSVADFVHSACLTEMERLGKKKEVAV